MELSHLHCNAGVRVPGLPLVHALIIPRCRVSALPRWVPPRALARAVRATVSGVWSARARSPCGIRRKHNATLVTWQADAIATPDAPDVRLEQNIGLGEVNQVAGFMGISSAADTSAGGERRSARRHRVFDYAAMNAGPAT